jgi:hypothetical protein
MFVNVRGQLHDGLGRFDMDCSGVLGHSTRPRYKIELVVLKLTNLEMLIGTMVINICTM